MPAKARYVAMGSSFAAGSGIMPSADTPANRCGRSASNYAHLLAANADGMRAIAVELDRLLR